MSHHAAAVFDLTAVLEHSRGENGFYRLGAEQGGIAVLVQYFDQIPGAGVDAGGPVQGVVKRVVVVGSGAVVLVGVGQPRDDLVVAAPHQGVVHVQGLKDALPHKLGEAHAA